MSAMTGGFKNPPCVVAVKKTNVSVGRAFRPAVTGSDNIKVTSNPHYVEPALHLLWMVSGNQTHSRMSSRGA